MRTPKIRLRDNGKYFLEYVDSNGKRIRKSLKSRDYSEAKVNYVTITGKFPEPELPPVVNTPSKDENDGMDFIEAYNKFMYSKYDIKDAWLAKVKGQCVKKSTVMRGTLKRFQEHSGVLCVSEIKYGNLQSFADMLSRRVSNASVNNHIQRLRRFLQFCVNHDWIVKNEANKLDRLKENTPTRYSFSKEEIEMIWEKINPQFLPFYQLMLETGLRAGDMWNLTKDNFIEGKQGMELHIQIGKTERWLRVPVSDRAKEIVANLDHVLFPWTEKSWWQENGVDNQRIQCRNALWMCFGSDHTGPDKNWGKLERGRTFCKPLNIRLHTFRHTFAMWHLDRGTPIEALKDLLGHRDLRMSQVYASHLSQETLRKYV